MDLKKKITHQDSGLLDPTWRIIIELPDLPDGDQDVFESCLMHYTIWVSIKMSWKALFNGIGFDMKCCFLQ